MDEDMDLFGDHFYRIFWLGIGPTTKVFKI